MTFRELWHWRGTVDRGPYALIGLLGFALKHNLDRVVATSIFGREWGLFNYWISPVEAVNVSALPSQDAWFLLSMVCMALPFIWVGVVLTLKRLRAIGLPGWWVAFFFLPFLNLLFFVILSVLPSRDHELPVGRVHWLDRLIPQHPVGSAAMGVLATNLLALPLVLFGTEVLMNYGWGLFVGVPFCVGLISVLIHSYHLPHRLLVSLAEATLAVCLVGLLLFALAIEGVICIALVTPLAVPLAWFGGFIGYLIQRRGPAARPAVQVYPVILLVLPSLFTAEQAFRPPQPTFAVRTALEVDAPPQQVWRQLVAFSHLPEPQDWIFRLGIAYPIRAEIHGTGPGAERHCVFSTGAFIEPIEVWREPRLLKFSVSSNPPPMQEWTPYHYIQPPHLEGFLVSSGGQFRLEPLAGGRTLLEGTTWYRHSMWPAGYWKLWSDGIIRRIHLRVLQHIKTTAEADFESL